MDGHLNGRTSHGYRAINRGEAAALQKCVFLDESDPDWLFRQCERIADALNKGELALAQIYGLRIPVDRLDDRLLRRIALAKAGYNPDEPRLPKGDPNGGEWTRGGDGSPEGLGAPADLLADSGGDGSQSSPGGGITWQWNSPATPTAPSTMDSPDLSDDGAESEDDDSSAGSLAGDAIYPDYTLENLLLLLGTGGFGRISSALARALIRAGIARAANFDTHHVVASRALRADPARKILQRFGIGFDDSVNGAFLPKAQHEHLHTNAYYDAVNKALAGATTKAEVEAGLRSIARQLESGTFP